LANLKLFISYNRHDEHVVGLVDVLNERLRNAGIQTFVDTQSGAGRIRSQEISQAIDRADAYVIVSGNEAPSHFQARELASVVEKVWSHPAQPVVPVVLAGAEPIPAFAEFRAIPFDDHRLSETRYVNGIVRTIVDTVTVSGPRVGVIDHTARMHEWQTRTVEIGHTIELLGNDGIAGH